MKRLLLSIVLVSCGKSNDVVSVESDKITPAPIAVSAPTLINPLTEELVPSAAQIISAECTYYIEGYKAGCLSLANKGQSKEDKNFGIKECNKDVECKL